MVLATGLILILIGIWGMLTHRNILQNHHRLLADGHRHPYRHRCDRLCHERDGPDHRSGRLSLAEAPSRAVDPIPSALVVTAIVIGLAVTAVMLAYAIRLYESKKTLSIDAFTESKW